MIAAIEVFPGDVRDSNCGREAVKGCELVFHLAALIAIPYSYRIPESYPDTNVTGAAKVVRSARAPLREAIETAHLFRPVR